MHLFVIQEIPHSDHGIEFFSENSRENLDYRSIKEFQKLHNNYTQSIIFYILEATYLPLTFKGGSFEFL